MTRIMVVDDESDIRFVIGKMLEKEGFEVVHAESGEEALELISSSKPDLVLLDIMMPGLDGWETCRKIKSRHGDLPVVMLTAKTDDVDKIRALEECRADWHISKPIDRGRFIKTVRWLLERPPRRED